MDSGSKKGGLKLPKEALETVQIEPETVKMLSYLVPVHHRDNIEDNVTFYLNPSICQFSF